MVFLIILQVSVNKGDLTISIELPLVSFTGLQVVIQLENSCILSCNTTISLTNYK